MLIFQKQIVMKLLEMEYKYLHYDDPKSRKLSEKYAKTVYKQGDKVPGFNVGNTRLQMVSELEEHIREKIAENFDGRVLTAGRVAHITGDKKFEGRSNCQFRNRCIRGCPYGGYFSSPSSTLPAASKTNNMTLRPYSIVSEVLYDPDTKEATGVKVIDTETKEEMEFKANVIFLCASAIASTSILMQSKSDRFPDGLGNDSGELGHNVMDHHFKAGASGNYDGFQDMYYKGRKPNGIYLPRFRNPHQY